MSQKKIKQGPIKETICNGSLITEIRRYAIAVYTTDTSNLWSMARGDNSRHLIFWCGRGACAFPQLVAQDNLLGWSYRRDLQ